MIIKNNVSSAANQHFRLIYEGSGDTKYWDNDAENSVLITVINYIFLYIHTDMFMN